MKNCIYLILSGLLTMTSCKKNPTVLKDEGNPNNEVKAMTSVGGSTAALHKANGNSTSFSRDIFPNGDTVIHVSGGMGEYGTVSSRNIKIMLTNISVAGTYSLNDNTSSREKALCIYQIGDVFFSSVFELYFSSHGSPSGTVTIEVLSPTEIKGSFVANCSNNEKGNNYVQITNGTFKGTFTK